MSYGDERFVGISDWSNTRRVFDAAKLRFEDQHLWLDAFVGRVVIPYDPAFNVANDYDWFWGLHASSRTLIPKLESQLYFFGRNVGDQSPQAITPTVGGRRPTRHLHAGRFACVPCPASGPDGITEWRSPASSAASTRKEIA